MNHFILSIILLVTINSNAQRVPSDSIEISNFALVTNPQHTNPDVIETTKGTLTIQPIFHATMVLDMERKNYLC